MHRSKSRSTVKFSSHWADFLYGRSSSRPFYSLVVRVIGFHEPPIEVDSKSPGRRTSCFNPRFRKQPWYGDSRKDDGWGASTPISDRNPMSAIRAVYQVVNAPEDLILDTSNLDLFPGCRAKA